MLNVYGRIERKTWQKIQTQLMSIIGKVYTLNIVSEW